MIYNTGLLFGSRHILFSEEGSLGKEGSPGRPVSPWAVVGGRDSRAFALPQLVEIVVASGAQGGLT